jgi:hypothetical protein
LRFSFVLVDVKAVRRSQQDLVDREMPGAAEDETDDLGDVVRGDLGLAVELLDTLPSLVVGDVVGEFGRDYARFDQSDPYVGQQLLAQGLRPTSR